MINHQGCVRQHGGWKRTVVLFYLFVFRWSINNERLLLLPSCTLFVKKRRLFLFVDFFLYRKSANLLWRWSEGGDFRPSLLLLLCSLQDFNFYMGGKIFTTKLIWFLSNFVIYHPDFFIQFVHVLKKILVDTLYISLTPMYML